MNKKEVQDKLEEWWEYMYPGKYNSSFGYLDMIAFGMYIGNDGELNDFE